MTVIDTMQSPATTDEHGSHGGPMVRTDRGLVELSVYETGVPPHFRLYFFDTERKPMGVPDNTTVTIDTIRPDGAKQMFTFDRRAVFLQSTDNIPEPHEFDVVVTVNRDGEAREYRSKFTEEGHEHGPGGHMHGPGGHSHGTGILGWLRGTFAHSHSAVDKVDSTMEANDAGIRALKISLVGLGITASFQLAIVLISGSIGLLADTIHNFADAGTSLPLWVAFSLTRRGASRRFTYGFGKTEDVAGVLIVLIIFFSACVAFWESVRKIIHPQPVTNLLWVAAAAIVGFIGNEAVGVFRIRVGTQIGSAALVADGQHARVDGFTSLAVFIGVIGAWLGYPIFDPIVGILITVAILFIVKDAAFSIWIRLIDGIEPEILAEIERALEHVPGVQKVGHVRARWIGHRVYSDVRVAVDPAMSVSDSERVAKQVEQSMRDHVRLLGEAVVHVSPHAA